MKLFQKGFTLIELMIAIAIVAILAAIALPAYLDYTTRAKVSEGLVIIDGTKLRLEELFYTEGWINPNMIGADTIQTENLGRYVQNAGWNLNNTPTNVFVEYGTGVLPVSGHCLGIFSQINNVNANLGTTNIAFQGEDKIVWTCAPDGAPTIPFKYLPTNCRNAGFDYANCP